MADSATLANRLAQLHARSGLLLRPWSEQEYQDLLALDRTIVTETNAGFAIGQIIATEAELLMIVVEPDRRKVGAGRTLLDTFEDRCRKRNVTEIFLEVGESNQAARRLYSKAGFHQVGLRKNYYTQTDNTKDSAVILLKNLR